MYTVRLSSLCLSLLVLLVALSPVHAADDHPVVAMVKSKVKDTSKPFVLLVTLKAKAGKEKDLEATFAPCLIATRKEPGCIAYELNRDTEDPTVYVMFEKFKSLKALTYHLEQEHTQKLLKDVAAFTDGEIKAKVFTVPE